MPFDARAKQILINTHWKSTGWIDARARVTSDADRAYAKAHGVMFDPLTIGHDALVTRTVRAAKALTARAVGAAFVASLSTRRCELRSALATEIATHGTPERMAKPRSRSKRRRAASPHTSSRRPTRGTRAVPSNRS